MSKHIVNFVRYVYVLSVLFLPILIATESTIKPAVTTASATERTSVNTTVSVTGQNPGSPTPESTPSLVFTTTYATDTNVNTPASVTGLNAGSQTSESTPSPVFTTTYATDTNINTPVSVTGLNAGSPTPESTPSPVFTTTYATDTNVNTPVSVTGLNAGSPTQESTPSPVFTKAYETDTNVNTPVSVTGQNAGSPTPESTSSPVFTTTYATDTNINTPVSVTGQNAGSPTPKSTPGPVFTTTYATDTDVNTAVSVTGQNPGSTTPESTPSPVFTTTYATDTDVNTAVSVTGQNAGSTTPESTPSPVFTTTYATDTNVNTPVSVTGQNPGSPTPESTPMPVFTTTYETDSNVNTTLSVTLINKLEITTVSETEPAATSAVDLPATSSEISRKELTEQESTELPTSDLQSTKASITELEIGTNEQAQEKSTVAGDFINDTSEPDQGISTVTEETTDDELTTIKEDATTSKLTSVESVTQSMTESQTDASIYSVTTGTEGVVSRTVTSFLGTTVTTQMADQTTVSIVMPTSTYLTSDLGSDRMDTTFGPKPSASDVVLTTEVDFATTGDVDDVTESSVAMTTEASMITDNVTAGTKDFPDRILTSFTEPSVVMTTDDDNDDSVSLVGTTTSSGASTKQETLTTQDDGGIESQSVMTTAFPVDITTNISVTSKPDDVRLTTEQPPIVSTISPEYVTKSDTLTPTSINLPKGPTSTSSVTSHSATEHVTQSEQRTTQPQMTKTQTPIQSTTRKPPTEIHPDELSTEEKSNCVVNAEIKSIMKEEWPDFKFRDFVASLDIGTPTRKRRQASSVNSKITADDVIYVKPTPQQIGDDLEIQFVVKSGTSYVQGKTLTEQLNKNREQIKSKVGIVLGALSVGIPVEKPKSGENSSSSDKNSSVFVAVITIACVSLVMLSAGLVYIVCDRRRARRGEYITDNSSEVDGGYDNPLMNEKKGTNGNGVHLVKVDTAMVPMEEQANGDKGKFEVEDTHL
ncbi:mucin-5AC-like [Anneissia japonica]|uniref:mucin-5AC-like n=1 Tax=Anneissia japonica TaxID=1529436 RepID=UPI001425686D|nr:mucin-5AC-like [Anneissia japonica]